MVTAHHVVASLDVDDEIFVSFGGACEGDDSVICEGAFLPDDYSAVETENPLLANRLWALGLPEYASESSKAVWFRKRLRTNWPFRIDAALLTVRRQFAAAPAPNSLL